MKSFHEIYIEIFLHLYIDERLSLLRFSDVYVSDPSLGMDIGVREKRGRIFGKAATYPVKSLRYALA